MNKLINLFLIATLFLCSISLASNAATRTLYTDEATFLSSVPNSLTDDYEVGSGYTGVGLEFYTSAEINAIFGQTMYTSTGFNELNLIVNVNGGSSRGYCAGCNGSFELDFTNTLYSQPGNGIEGFGVDIYANRGYTVFVSYGDGSTENISIPPGNSYLGITSPDLIRTVHFGLPNAGTTTSGYLEIDNLSIGGSPPPPIPTVSEWGLIAFTLLLASLGITVLYRKRNYSAV